MTTQAVKNAAKERAWRTFKQQFILDIAIVLMPFFIDILANTSAWGTQVYWVTVGVSIGKTVLGMALAYLMRIKNPPNEEVAK